MTIQLLISTLNDGIRAAVKIPLAPRDGVRYLIVWQQTAEWCAETPEDERQALLDAVWGRDDVDVVRQEGRGLSRSRNLALEKATGDVLLISDDDTQYRPECFLGVLEAFRQNPEADICLFRALDENGMPMRRYPAHTFAYADRPRGYYAASWEIALRRRADLPRFDERFGLGSEYLAAGEEDVFLFEAYRRGLQIRYIPQYVVQTDSHTTGRRFWYAPEVQRSKGAVLQVVHGTFWGTLHAWREVFVAARPLAVRWKVWREVRKGMRYVRKGVEN